jgi:cell wall-associated NlpC family hydrolase
MAELQHRWIDATVPDVPPRRGDLVFTDDGYPGIVVRYDGTNEHVVVFVGNGLRCRYRTVAVKAVLLPGSKSTANFSELMRDG